ncbi:MAG TPA: protein kinase, partial [Polyangia bacterium]|nr:protein kinase [Polyangia bacterium]
RGETHRLDRRTDVYSLGATLYELLSGQPPFHSSTSLNVLVKVLDSDPTPPRKLDARIPVDLETIVMKCLEKEPQRRYETAKALAQDLARYLDGEPVLARRASLVYRVRTRARKHKAVVAVAAVASVGLLILGATALEARRTAAEKAQLAQHFGQEVEKMEALSRYAYLLPLHDTRPQKSLIRERMQAISAQMRALGDASQAPGHYALGRGHLALRELAQARRELETAWRRGFRTPEVGFALGQTLSALYEHAMEEAQRIGSPEMRAARHKEIERELREPALGYLKAAGSSVGETVDYAEGLLAFIEKRYDEAQAKARQAFAAVPWLYEARRLEGDVWLARGRERAERGDYAGALDDYDHGGQAYRTAIDLARSDPAVHTAECARFTLALAATEKRGQSPLTVYQGGLLACDQALTADPEDADALGRKAALHAMWGLHQAGHGQDPTAALARAISLAEQATRRSPRELEAWLSWGYAHETRADYEIAHGQDPNASLSQAIHGYRTVLDLDPNFAQAWSSLGNAHLSRAEWEEQHGRDPRPPQGAAVAAYQKAVALNPDYAAGYNNIANVYLMRAAAETDRGEDPRPSLARAIESYQQAVQKNPNLTVAHNNLGLCWQERADYEVARGEDPRPSLERAINSFERAVAQNPSYANGWHNLGATHRKEAAYLADQGVEPGPALSAARAALAHAGAINAEDFEQYVEQAEQALVAARWALARSSSPVAALDAGERAVGEGLRRNAEASEIHRVRAELLYRRAEWLLREKQAARAREVAQRGLVAIGRARAINPEHVESLLLAGRLELLAGRLEPAGGSRSQAAQRAQAALGQALARNPGLREKVDPLLAEARALESEKPR